MPSVSESGKKFFPENDRSVKIHKHSQREILFVLEGQCSCVVNGYVYELMPGNLLLIDSYMPHSLGFSSKTHDFLCLWFFFWGDRLNAQFCQVQWRGDYRLGNHISLPRYSYMLFISRWNSLKKRGGSFQEESLYLLNPFRCLLEDIAFSMENETNKQNKGSDLIQTIQLYIDECNACGCTLKTLETIFNYNRFYLAHLFQKQTGEPIGDYINRVRFRFMESAKMQGLKQKEIAYELGFSSPSAFAKWCKRNCKK